MTTVHVYEAAARFGLRQGLRELWAFREVVLAFAERKLRTRYKQALFGAGWAIGQPLAFLAVFVAFLERADHTEASYAAGTYGALVLWQYANAATASAGSALVSDASLLRRVYFPREAPVIGSVLAFLPDLAVNVVLLAIIAPVLGGTVGPNWLLLPIPIALAVLVSLAVGLPLAALAVYYRDFLYALPIGVQLWLFASPVVYPLAEVPARWHNVYAFANPLVAPIESFRRAASGDQPPPWEQLGWGALSTLVLLASGYRLLKALERRMADVV